ncbi:aldehyde dehydrogenase family protein [Acinetobacter baumannii]
MTISNQSLILPIAGQTGLFINGEWLEPKNGQTIDIENPCNRQIIQSIGRSEAHDVDLAVKAAKNAFKSWKLLAARTRGAMLLEFGHRVAQHCEEIAQVLAAETGNAIRTQSRPETMSAAEVLKYYGGVIAEQKGETLPLGPGLFSYTTREPLGVVGAIIPWNSPLVLAAVKIAMSLGTGNTLVLKPAEDAPLAVIKIIELAADIFPKGVLNIVTGIGEEAGAALSEHEDVAKVSFTGSLEVGKIISHSVANRIGRATLELGGKSPCIVYPDAATPENINATVQGIIAAMRFARQGQSCTAGSRLYVHQSVWNEVMPLVVEQVKALRIGDALSEDTDIGAIINKERYGEVRAFIKEAIEEGAEVLTGTIPDEVDQVKGFFPEPVILTGINNSWRVCKEEVFGPVLVALPWDDEAEVIDWANDTVYGLAAYIFTNNITTALNASQKIEAGWLQINRAGGQIPGMSYGGVKRSGIGAEYSIESALESYTTRKSVTINM